jgi:hypothetical protein
MIWISELAALHGRTARLLRSRCGEGDEAFCQERLPMWSDEYPNLASHGAC